MRTLTLLTAATLVLLACGDDNGSDPTPPDEGDITVGNNFFDPDEFAASVGGTVTWAWAAGSVAHNIIFDDGAPGSGTQSSGTFERTFNAPGAFTYFCSIHGASVMSGVVNVAAPGSGDGGGGGGGGDGGSGNPY